MFLSYAQFVFNVTAGTVQNAGHWEQYGSSMSHSRATICHADSPKEFRPFYYKAPLNTRGQKLAESQSQYTIGLSGYHGKQQQTAAL